MTPPRDRHIPDLVSSAEAASLLEVTRQAIQLMANNGQLLGAKVGSTWVFRDAEVRKVKKRRDAALGAEALEHPEKFAERSRPKKGSAPKPSSE